MVGCLQFAVDTLKTFGFDSYEADLSTWDNGVSASKPVASASKVYFRIFLPWF